MSSFLQIQVSWVMYLLWVKVFPRTSFDLATVDKAFSKYKKNHSSKELISSADTRDDKQDVANFCWISKSESLWKGCCYVKGVGDLKGPINWLRKSKINHYTGKQQKYDEWPAVWGEVIEVKADLLVLETVKWCPWICSRELGRELLWLTRMPVLYFPQICYDVLKTEISSRWFEDRNLMLYQGFRNQWMVICNQQTAEPLQMDSNAVKYQNLVQFLCASNVFSKNVTRDGL